MLDSERFPFKKNCLRTIIKVCPAVQAYVFRSSPGRHRYINVANESKFS